MLSNKVKEIMSRDVITANASSTTFDVMELMAAKNVGGVIITDNQLPVGIFTERDVLKRVAIKNVDARKTPIGEVMTVNPITAAHSALIGEVLAEMYKNDFRNMPILGDRGDLVGIVSMGDVLKYAKALDVDESVRKAWKEIEEFWDSEEHYTPG